MYVGDFGPPVRACRADWEKAWPPMVRVSVIDLHGLVNHWTSAERDKPSLGDFAGGFSVSISIATRPRDTVVGVCRGWFQPHALHLVHAPISP